MKIMRTSLLLLSILIGALIAIASADETDCFYPWHDHYKTNYRKRHMHKVCGSVAEHYRKDEPFRTMQLYYPGVYLGEVPENEEDKITIKNLRKLLQETAE